MLYKCFIVYLLSLSTSNAPSRAILMSEALCSISVLLSIYWVYPQAMLPNKCLISDPHVRGAVLYKCFIVYLLSLSSSNAPSPAIRRSEALCSISVLLSIYWVYPQAMLPNKCLTSDPHVRGAVLYKCFIVYLLSLSSSNAPSPAIRRSEALCSISVLLSIYWVYPQAMLPHQWSAGQRRCAL